MSDPLQAGDWVRADSGEIGRVVHTTRLSAFVQMAGGAPESTVRAFLVSQLTKIDPPIAGDEPEK
jgi:hypothetical protein